MVLCTDGLSDFLNSLFVVEGAVTVLVSVITFIYLNIEDDLLKENKFEFMEGIRDGNFETISAGEQEVHYNNKLTELVMDVTKNKLEEKINY